MVARNVETANSEEQKAILNQTIGLSEGQHKTVCPLCIHERKKKQDKSLSVNINNLGETIYHCHHCGAKGKIRREPIMQVVQTPQKPKTKITLPALDESEKSEEWLQNRGIDIDVAKECGVIFGKKKGKDVIGFKFEDDKGLSAVKYRSANGEKVFWWEGTAQKLWGNNVIDDKLGTVEDTVVITEGECDLCAIKTAFAGHLNLKVYSVPNGSPSKITDGQVDPKEDGRFKYVWECKDVFEGVERVILATDNDNAGDVLAHELSRRLDIARCYRVDFKGCKDANELLLKEGRTAVVEQIVKAEAIPLSNLYSIDKYADDFQALYDDGMPSGISTGISSLDKIFKLSQGNLVVVTGYPGDGKSAFIDQIVVNAAKNYGWKTCFCSFEKPTILHSAQLSQLIVKKPFFKDKANRMTQEEKDDAQAFIKEHFLFQDYFSGELPTIDNILSRCQSAIMRLGVRILVIDPFNFLHYEKTGLDTDAISDLLTKIQMFCKKFQIVCFFVCHPAKPSERTGKKQVCTGLDVAKSMAFFSKCDTGLTVYRADDHVQIHNWKTRYTWHGSVGAVELDFVEQSGTYVEREAVEDDYDWDSF